MALITVSGSSNWMYSELLWAKICFEFEDSLSQRAWATVISCSYLRCFGVSGGFVSRWPTAWFPEVRTRMGREPNERRCCCRFRPLPFVPFLKNKSHTWQLWFARSPALWRSIPETTLLPANPERKIAEHRSVVAGQDETSRARRV